VLYTLFFCISMKIEKFGLKGFMKNYKKRYALTIISKEMQKSTTFTTIFRVKKCYFHYDFACKKVPLSLRYAYSIHGKQSWCYQKFDRIGLFEIF
jgi:hypothetical protein